MPGAVVDYEQVAGFLPLVLIAVVFWFLVLRPARRRQQDAAKLQESLSAGDRIMLTSGIFGSVVGMGDDSLEVEVAAGTVITVHRQAVAKIVESPVVDGPGDGHGDDSSTPEHGDESRA
ncbi:MAG: preprotein translocase subunit YajC [Nocardioidaceae bacterium]|nr:preprotein translocase subunit YajC [Nocardioidaceae bacterium]